MAEKILVVDDSHLSVKIARIVLAGLGYEILEAGSAEDALVILETALPAVLLVDLELPHMSGLELARLLRADRRFDETAIVAFSAHALDEDKARAHAAGCDGYVTKPIDMRTFGALVTGYLRRGAPEAVAFRARFDPVR